MMNWDDIKTNPETQKVFMHWQKLGVFRKNHIAVGAGIHKEISASPYTFSRTFKKDNFTDNVVVGLDLPKGSKEISVGTIFEDGTKLKDWYSGKKVMVTNGKVMLDTEFDIVLLETSN
jgi:alpha-amylase